MANPLVQYIEALFDIGQPKVAEPDERDVWPSQPSEAAHGFVMSWLKSAVGEAASTRFVSGVAEGVNPQASHERQGGLDSFTTESIRKKHQVTSRRALSRLRPRAPGMSTWKGEDDGDTRPFAFDEL